MIDGRLRVPGSVKRGEPFEVRVLIQHPMENGFRREADGRAVPVHIVNRLACRYGGREVFRADLGTGISANPYFVFYVRAGESGPLHRASIFGSEAAGDRLEKMMLLGSSRPWPEALEVLTGEREMDARAILDYFAPLSEWLARQNQGRVCGW